MSDTCDVVPKILDLPIDLDAAGMRRKFDRLGDVKAPANRYSGAQTRRVVTQGSPVNGDGKAFVVIGHSAEASRAMSSQATTRPAVSGVDPQPAAVTFITTEHFTLQGARAATIAESTGRATMFLGSVSAGLVALGLIATATHIGAPFYAFGVVLLATLSFIGVVTFERVLQSGIEDHGYAQRIARLRGFYFDYAPEITGYLVSVPPPQRLSIQGLDTGCWRGSRTIAGMVGVVTAVLAGSAAALIAADVADHSAVAGFITGGVVAVASLVVLMRFQSTAWRQICQHPYFDCQPVAAPRANSERHSR